MLGDVAEDKHHTDQLAAGVANGGCAIENRAFGAIFGYQDSIVGEADDNTFLKHFGDRKFDRLSGCFVDDFERVGQRHSSSLLECVAGEAFGNRIHEGDMSPAIGDNDRVTNAGQGNAKALLALAQAVLGALLLGDVSGDFRCADNLATTVFDWRDGQRNVDQRSVFPPPHRFVMFNPLSQPEPFEVFRLLILVTGWDEDGDGLAHYLGGSVAKYPFGSLVPTGDDPIQVFADNGVI